MLSAFKMNLLSPTPCNQIPVPQASPLEASELLLGPVYELQTDSALTSYTSCTYNIVHLLPIHTLFPKSAVFRGLLDYCSHGLVQTQSNVISWKKHLCVIALPSVSSNTAATTTLQLYLKSQLAGPEVALWLRGLPALPEDGDPIPSTHKAAHNHL